MNANEAYEVAVEAHNAASRAYRIASNRFRADQISRAEWFAAIDEWKKACAAFDAAFDVARASGAELLDQSVKPRNPYVWGNGAP